MRVLVISGDPAFKEGNERYELHKQAVDQLDVFSYRGFVSGPIGFFQILWVAIRTQYDVIVSQEPFWRGVLALVAARVSGARLHVQVHVQIQAQSVVKRLLARFVLKHADSIRVVSEKLKTEVLHINDRAPIHVLPVFVDLDRFKDFQRNPSEKPTLLWIGRFEPEKDPLLAVRVFQKVYEQDKNAHMIMLGTGSLEKKVKSEAKDLPIEFPGWKDPAPYIARAHVVLSTSPAESWGASIIEALAAGVPVVSRDVGIAKEAGAIVVEKDQLADTVLRTLVDPPAVTLRIPMLSKEEWSAAWQKTLV